MLEADIANQALSLARRQRWRQLLRLLDTASLPDDSAWTWHLKGVAHLHLGDVAVSRQQLQRARELDKGDAAIIRDQVVTAIADGDMVAATGLADDLKAVSGNSAANYKTAALMDLEAQRFAEAAAKLNAAVILDGDDTEAWNNLAIAAAGQHRWHQAWEAISKANRHAAHSIYWRSVNANSNVLQGALPRSIHNLAYRRHLRQVPDIWTLPFVNVPGIYFLAVILLAIELAFTRSHLWPSLLAILVTLLATVTIRRRQRAEVRLLALPPTTRLQFKFPAPTVTELRQDEAYS